MLTKSWRSFSLESICPSVSPSISTFENWCNLYRPWLCWPLPASALKQWLKATMLWGNSFLSTISLAYIPAKGISAVPIRHSLEPSKWYTWAELSRGRNPHASTTCCRAKSGVVTAVKPFLETRFRAQLHRANSSIAASFFRKTNLFPVSFEAFWKSIKSKVSAISICVIFLGNFSFWFPPSWILISKFLFSPPIGAEGCVLLGNFKASATSYPSSVSITFSLAYTSFFIHFPTF